jgi:hypothetical protein
VSLTSNVKSSGSRLERIKSTAVIAHSNMQLDGCAFCWPSCTQLAAKTSAAGRRVTDNGLMGRREIRQQMAKARAARKALCNARRAEKRAATRTAKKARQAEERRAARAAARQQRQAAQPPAPPRRPVGRPRKPVPHQARWTDYHPSYALEVYKEIRFGDMVRPTRQAVAEFFRIHPNTADHWHDRHPEFRRAIERGIVDRGALGFAVYQNRKVVVDLGKPNEKAKTLRGRHPEARIVSVELDHDAIERVQRTIHLRRRDRPDIVEALRHEALDAVERHGALSNRAIARVLDIPESVLRTRRQQDPRLDRAIHDAIAAVIVAEEARRELWSPGGFQRKIARELDELRQAGIIRDREELWPPDVEEVSAKPPEARQPPGDSYLDRVRRIHR